MFVRGARSSCMDMVYLQHGGGNYRRRAPRSAPRTESVKLPAKCTDGIFASTCSQSVPCKFRRTCLPARAAYHRHSLVQSRVRSSSSFPVFSGVALSSRPPPLSLSVEIIPTDCWGGVVVGPIVELVNRHTRQQYSSGNSDTYASLFYATVSWWTKAFRHYHHSCCSLSPRSLRTISVEITRGNRKLSRGI